MLDNLNDNFAEDDGLSMDELGLVPLYNFQLDETVPVDLHDLTDDDAVQFIPQHPVAQSAYHLLRAKKDSTVLEALIDVVMVTLISGGQRKFIHVRDGGRV